ncbi:MAG TPA: TRAP transporter small permease [Rhodocyclaceae bacterium]|nr:TRAP transporter small permease [Rhodocyclaceae bacterium]HNH35358.1 TRAP transporter small permease [Rhodocyclaceae bacterium]
MKAFVHFVEVSSRWFAVGGMLLLGMVVLVVMADVAMRRTVDVSVPGTTDLIQLAVMTSFFLALPSAFLHEANVGVEFVTDRLPPRPLFVLKAAVALLAAAFMAATTWYCFGQAVLQISNGDRSQTIGIPIAFFWAPLLLGCALAVSSSLLLALRYGLESLGRADYMAGEVERAEVEL